MVLIKQKQLLRGAKTYFHVETLPLTTLRFIHEVDTLWHTKMRIVGIPDVKSIGHRVPYVQCTCITCFTWTRSILLICL